MKTLCIKNFSGAFEKDQVYKYSSFKSEMGIIYHVHTKNKELITFIECEYIFERNYKDYFSHKLYQRKQKLERICK